MHKKRSVLCHGRVWRKGRLTDEVTILIKDGVINKIADGFCKELVAEANQVINLNGAILFPSWIDSHLHIPGSLLFKLYGVDLQSGCNVSDYIRLIDNSISKCGTDWIRGFGWNTPIMEKDGYAGLASHLEKKFKYTPVILFSDDYHSCMCNSRVLNKIAKNGISVKPNKYNIIKEKDIFQITVKLQEISFPERQMEEAILKYQDELLSVGVTVVQALMFLGGNGDREWKVIHQLDVAGKLKIKINLALTVQPYEDLVQVEERLAYLKLYETERVKVHTVKIYMDGVLENETAFLTKAHSSGLIGSPIWEQNKLRVFVVRLIRQDIKFIYTLSETQLFI